MNRTVLSAANLRSIQTVLKGYFDQVVQAHDRLGRRGQTNYSTSNAQWVLPPLPSGNLISRLFRERRQRSTRTQIQ